jgi:hydrogenase expression/formation protein HypC
MCLAVPGKVVEVRTEHQAGARMAKVDFQGSRVSASLMFTPEAQVGDWVLVHAGFAIRRLNEQEALETWKYLQPDDLEEITE